jgi:hypothetical protein
MCLRGGQGAHDGAVRCRRVRGRAFVRRRGENGGQLGAVFGQGGSGGALERACMGGRWPGGLGGCRPATTTRPGALADRDLRWMGVGRTRRRYPPTVRLRALASARQLQRPESADPTSPSAGAAQNTKKAQRADNRQHDLGTGEVR